MNARPVRRWGTPDGNGKIFYTSITSLSHISICAGIVGEKAFYMSPADYGYLEKSDR